MILLCHKNNRENEHCQQKMSAAVDKQDRIIRS